MSKPENHQKFQISPKMPKITENNKNHPKMTKITENEKITKNNKNC